MKYFDITKIFWDFDRGQPKNPQSKKTCENNGVKTTYVVECEDEDGVIDLVSDLTGFCIFRADIKEITKEEFDS